MRVDLKKNKKNESEFSEKVGQVKKMREGVMLELWNGIS